MTRLLLADDERVVRQALRYRLEREPDLRVVGETADGLETLRVVTRLKPDVLVTAAAHPACTAWRSPAGSMPRRRGSAS